MRLLPDPLADDFYVALDSIGVHIEALVDPRPNAFVARGIIVLDHGRNWTGRNFV
jgi:hypothetical protein